MIYHCYQGQETCERCHRPVDKDKAVWFELNSSTGEYLKPGTVPEDESQGCFAFVHSPSLMADDIGAYDADGSGDVICSDCTAKRKAVAV